MTVRYIEHLKDRGTRAYDPNCSSYNGNGTAQPGQQHTARIRSCPRSFCRLYGVFPSPPPDFYFAPAGTGTEAGRGAAKLARGRQAEASVPVRHGTQWLADHAAGMVPRPAQPDDRTGRRCRTLREDVELRRARRDARPGRFLPQRVVASPNGRSQHFGLPARRIELLRQETRSDRDHSAKRHRDLYAPARIAPEPGRVDSGRTGFRIAVRCGPDLLWDECRGVEASAVHLHS